MENKKNNYLELALINTVVLYLVSGCYKLGIFTTVIFATIMVLLQLFSYWIWFKFLRKGAVIIYEKIKEQTEKWREAFKKAED